MRYGTFQVTPAETPAKPNPTRAAHPGSGRPAGYSPKEAEESDDPLNDPNVSEATKRAIRASIAKMEKVEWDAKNAELKYKIDSGEYLSRAAMREACATLLAEVAHSLRSLPDLLERKAAMEPKQLQLVEQTIDATLATLADGLELFVEQPAGANGE